MQLKKSAKFRKNEKTQHLMRCFKSKKQFKINFYNFCQFLVHFEQKVAKNVFFCDFRKNTSMWEGSSVRQCFIPLFAMQTVIN